MGVNKVTWKPIPGFPGYEASEDGQIRSVKVLKAAPRGAGYMRLGVYRDGRQVTQTAHRLTAMAFLGEPPFEGAQVNHIDGDKLNNHISNLEWVTPSENIQHAVATGLRTSPSGEEHYNCTVDDVTVRSIRRLSAKGWTGKDIAERHGISTAHVSRIINGRARNGSK